MNRKIKKILKTMEEVFGIWKDREFGVNAYIRGRRKDRKMRWK